MNNINTLEDFEENFIRFLKTNLNKYVLIHKLKTKIVIKLQKKKSVSSSVSLKFLESIFDIIRNKKISNETVLFDNKNYEVFVQRNAVMGPPFMSVDEKQFDKEDKVNKLTYNLTKPSIEYMMFLIVNSVENRDIIIRRFRLEEDIEDILTKGKSDEDFISSLSLLMPRTITLRIKSEDDRSLDFFEKVSDSFLFSIAYNTRRSFLKVKSIVNDSENRKLRMMQIRRRRSVDEIEPPKRMYLKDLLNHYQMAISVRIPCQQYLSFYHILEHFFEEIYNDELISEVGKMITQPDFSYKSKKEIEKLIKLITKKVKIKYESYEINEIEALNLVLMRFIDLDKLKDDLNDERIDLLKHYKENKVSFSDGKRIDFSEASATVYKQIADRLYKTRNSIVHSKSGNKNRYRHFKHDPILIKELPLIQHISEQIILATSSEF